MILSAAILWAVVILLTVVIEILTVQFVSIWFSCAALVCLILAILGVPIWAELIAFCVVTTVLLIITRPLARKLRGSIVRTNYDMNIGMTAVVTEDILNDRGEGRAILSGVSWKAVSEDGSPIRAGDSVVVKDVEGAKLIVSKK